MTGEGDLTGDLQTLVEKLKEKVDSFTEEEKKSMLAQKFIKRATALLAIFGVTPGSTGVSQ